MPAADLDAIDRLIGRNIRFHRLRRELSQAKLATSIGISFQQLQKYERGVNRISAGRLMHIARVFGVPIGALYEVSEHEYEPAAAHWPIARGEEARLRVAYVRISDGERRRLIADLAEQLAVRDS